MFFLHNRPHSSSQVSDTTLLSPMTDEHELLPKATHANGDANGGEYTNIAAYTPGPSQYAITQDPNTHPESPTTHLESPSTELPTLPLTGVQFATYPDEKPHEWGNGRPQDSGDTLGTKVMEGWRPIPLRTWYWLSLVLFMVGIAIGLEIALHFSQKNHGWPTKGTFTTETGFMHFVYTLPPVAVAMIIVSLWAWTDIEVKKLQPYVDLVHGNSPPHKSLLLDYTRINNFLVWFFAFTNKHHVVFFASIMTLVALTLQPLAAALCTVRDTWWTEPDTTVHNLALIGLNQNAQFLDLTSFLSAAGYASASVQYNLSDPSFVHDVYTIGPLELPTNLASNGTVFANTTAIKSDPGCQSADSITMQQLANGSGWTNSASSGDCSFSWDVSNNTTNLFGTSVSQCSNASTTPVQFQTVVFWFFTYSPSAKASITFCRPTISLWDVNVAIDLASGNLTAVNPLRPFDIESSNFSSAAGNVTGAPLDGQAYNGISFSLNNSDPFILARESSIQLQMPAAIFLAAETSPDGLQNVFDKGTFVQLSTQVYTMYLKLIAKSVYFLPAEENIAVQVKTVQKRLWLSPTAVHILASVLFLLALFRLIIQFLHHRDRRGLVLDHEPGTIASAVSIGAQTGIGNLLAGRRTREEIILALRDKKFRIDPRAMKIVMEGEEGYEQAASPDPQKSIFAYLNSGGLGRRISKRFSRPSATTIV